MLTESEKLCALGRWVRERGLPYGKLANNYSQLELDAIYGEYDDLLKRRQKAEESWVSFARRRVAVK